MLSFRGDLRLPQLELTKNDSSNWLLQRLENVFVMKVVCLTRQGHRPTQLDTTF